ncbi:methyltransferase [Rhizobium sp. Root149]|uniref:class I SAM-dependent DNA methyltransferase n=1 Tax=Rhizobium sp. Root149 TaxID=1736473 RepID=UPI000715C1B5|nr:methyltransferase [Rhizobium sp. Root149]KQZ50697.1 methyltransferase [Rhizobium sp. Root149]
MSANQFSSGDVIADRRADYARMLAESGDHAAAAELFEQALEIAPDWTAGWLLAGEAHQKAGAREAAIAAFEQVMKRDRQGLFGASLKLAALDATPAPDAPPSAYVEGLFDDYADRFEISLVEKLNYSVPAKLFALVQSHGPFDLTVDLGCGTGLFGVEIASDTARLEGFDLSANMLAKAGEKGIYHHLGQADLSRTDADTSLFSEDRPRHRADLVSAADVLMYLGNLDVPFALADELLKPRGLFAFSVEDAGSSTDGFVLQQSLRYAHTQSYIETLLARHVFDLVALSRTDIRMDAGKPVHGILFLARKRA